MVVIADRPKPKTPEEEAHAVASANVEEQYRDLDVVWAKMPAFPWWPAVLFYSWQAVADAGLDLKDAQKELVIPPPTMQPLPDGKGSRLVHSVLVMFLDKFNCLVLELSPKTVCPFAINYDKLHKIKSGGKSGGKTSGFKVALQRAERLLHMSNHMTEETLDELAVIRVENPMETTPPPPPPPPPVKKLSGGNKRQKRSHQRVEEVEQEQEVDCVVIEDDDDEEPADDEDGSDYAESTEADRKTPSRSKPKGGRATGKAVKNASVKAPRVTIDLSGSSMTASKSRTKKKGVFKHVEAIDEDDFEDDFEVQVPPRAEKKEVATASKRKKASRKEGRIHQQPQVIDVDEDEDANIANMVMAMGKEKKKAVKAKPIKKHVHAVAQAKSDAKVKKIVTKKKKIKKKDHTGFDSESEKDGFDVYEDEVIESAPEPKKKAKKKTKSDAHHAHDHGDPQEKSRSKIKPTEPEALAYEPLTLTPLSTIWTTREAPNADEQCDASQPKASEGDPRPGLAYNLDMLWDDELFTETLSRSEPRVDGAAAEDLNAPLGASSQTLASGERASSRRQVRSVHQSQIRQSLMSGTLEPHTMVQCEAYIPKGGLSLPPDVAGRGSRAAAPQLEAPFEVVVHPDAVFICDLHAHLATCEIIGFLGGRWDDARKTLYIQAAFPCRSLVIEGDDGSTDVEMDPGSEIELREIIQNAQLEVVGWYHSHPEFAPDPSVVDINNQSNYQQLFQRRKTVADGKVEIAEPFVGLIVGTYDTRRESPVALFRYFHTRAERVNSGMRREVNMPYELVPRKRHYRAVLESERRDPNRWSRWYVGLAKLLLAKMKERSASDATPTTKPRKRKGSTDVTAQRGESATKKKRGRPARAQSSQDLTSEAPEVIDLMSETSQEIPSQSSDVVSSTPSAVTAAKATDESVVVELLEDEVAEGKVAASTREDEMMECIASSAVGSPEQAERDVEMVVAESSQSQNESAEVDVEDGSSDERNALLPTVASDEVVAEDDSSGAMSEEIVDDSSTSQEVTNTIPQMKASRPVGRLDGRMEGDDDFVSASGPSSGSSSLGDSSFLSYDASQSQSMSQSQSQNDEVAPPPAAPTAEANTMMDDDPYASIEVIELRLSPEKLRRPAPVTEFSEDAVKAVIPLNPVEDESVSIEKTIQPADDQVCMAIDDGDGIVKDSATDSATEGSEAGRDAVCPEASPRDNDSGSNSALSGGGSTPLDVSAALPSSRRRTRKPSTTNRRGDTPTLNFASTTRSPRMSSVSVVQAMRETATTGNGQVKILEEDAVWGGVEVIDGHYVKQPASPAKSDAVKPEEKIDVKAEKSELVSVTVVKEEKPYPQTSATKGNDLPNGKSNVLDLIDVDATTEQVANGETSLKPDADFEVTTHPDAVVELPSAAVVVNIKNNSDVSTPVVPLAEAAPPGEATVVRNVAAFLSKPLGNHTIIELENLVMQMGVRGKKPRRKAELIDFILEHGEGRNPAAFASSAPSAPAEQSAQDDATDAARSAPVSDEAKEVVEALVQAVEALALKEAKATIVPPKTEATEEAVAAVVPANAAPIPKRSKAERLHARREKHLERLRTQYGAGIFGCAEQVITLIDYYRDFDRRTDMNGWWKPRITKADKLEASLRADVQHVNVPVELRNAFVTDIMGYLLTSWEICSVRR